MDINRVLIVDDEPMQRRLVSEVLNYSDDVFEIHEASNGVEAIDFIKAHEVDVILLDKRMPEMDGDEVCQKIRHDLNMPLIPIIMVTGNTESIELAKSLDAGANEFVRKPYSPVELVARVKGAIRNKRQTDQLDNAENLLFTLARMVEAKDETTGDHCSRLSHMSVVYGKALGLSERELTALRRGGVLHDIGKLGIPDSILLKNGPLNDAEWEIMRQHTIIGGHICSSLTSMKDVVQIIMSHHERYDGTGYPYGLKGKEIPLLARVFQTVDIYDALASDRPYKKAFDQEKIIAIFEEETEKGWRDPELTATFLKILRETPEQLVLQKGIEPTVDQILYEEIATTGVIDWMQNMKMGNQA